MPPLSREFQVFVKLAGSQCNLSCKYCYYLEKRSLYPADKSVFMPPDILEKYIIQHIEASTDRVVRFSWHGGEPTLPGLDYFQNLVKLEKKHCPPGKRMINGIQTNGTLLNESWCRFLAEEDFFVGISLDGSQEMHDHYRVTRNGKPTFDRVMRGWDLLRKHHIAAEILCVVNDDNSRYPTAVYRFFKEIGARFITFLPLVERTGHAENHVPGRPAKVTGNTGHPAHKSILKSGVPPTSSTAVSRRSVLPEAWGNFLCTIFDEWIEKDIGNVEVQIFNEAASTAFDREHTLCIFKKTCGDVPVVEHNGDFYACDHFVDPGHLRGNIRETPLAELLESPEQRAFGQAKWNTLPGYCQNCEVRDMCNGECPKNRFIKTPDGEPGLNYLCAGYRRFFTQCRPFVQAVAELSK